MEEVEHPANYAVKGLADEELKNKLKERKRKSEGMADANCFLSNIPSSRDLCTATLPQSEPSTEAGEAPATPRLSNDACEDPTPAGQDETNSDEITEAAAEDEGDKLEYEWQFDILSSFPREKAIELVEHLRRSESERAKATATAFQLQRTIDSLEAQLDTAVGLLREKDPGNPKLAALLTAEADDDHEAEPASGTGCLGRWVHRLGRCLLGLVAVAVLLMPAAAFFLLASAPLAPPLDTRLRSNEFTPSFMDVAEPLPFKHSEDMENELAATGALDLDRQVRLELEEARRSLATCEAKLDDSMELRRGASESPGDDLVRKTTVREMTLRETKTTEHDPNVVARLSQENEAMRGQLERLWLDIDQAIQRNQEMVCWKL